MPDERDDRPDGVVATGQGEATGPPDRARLRLAAEGVELDAQRALAAASAGLRAMRAGVLSAGVATADLQTTGTSLWTEESPRRTTQFRARLSMVVVVRDATRAGEVLSAAMQAGAPAARMDGIEFVHSDPSALQAAARQAAFEDAVAHAEQYAALAGRRLGAVRRVEERGSTAAPRQARLAMAMDAVHIPVDAGEQAVQAAVTVTWGWA